MGTKTAILIVSDGDTAECLQPSGTLDPLATADLVTRAHPDWTGATTGGATLGDAFYPEGGQVYAGSFPSVDILCDRTVLVDRPSELPPHLVALGAGRRLLLHTMHSVSDFFGYGIWEDGTLVRSLSLSPGDGVTENIGEPLPFEQPFWAGEHPMGTGYPLPFHPLELGEDGALKALFGMTLRLEDPVQRIRLNGFTVPYVNPITPEMLEEFKRTHKRTRYRLVDGKLVKAEE
jgi:uncharacterized protein DUF6928